MIARHNRRINEEDLLYQSKVSWTKFSIYIFTRILLEGGESEADKVDRDTLPETAMEGVYYLPMSRYRECLSWEIWAISHLVFIKRLLEI